MKNMYSVKLEKQYKIHIMWGKGMKLSLRKIMLNFLGVTIFLFSKIKINDNVRANPAYLAMQCGL